MLVRVVTPVVMILAMVGAMSCSDVRLVTKEEPKVNVKSQGHFCISDPKEVMRFMKFLFVIDKSGSNSDSDPGGVKRSRNIEKFVKENEDKDFYRYGMIIFEGNRGAEAYIHNGDRQMPTFTDDPNEVYEATARIRSEGEGVRRPTRPP